MTATVTFRLRRDTTGNWSSVNPTLALGEPGYDTATRKLKIGDGATAWNSLGYVVANVNWGDIGGTLSAQTDLAAALALKAPLASPALTGTPTAPTASPGTNTTQLATTAFVAALVSLATTGLFDLKGDIDCSASPNYPAALKGDAYVVSVAGKIGGASGIAVDVGDTVIAKADNAGGTQASVGSSWWSQEHNLAGALVAANNLSDVLSAATARSNLGLGSAATMTGPSGSIVGTTDAQTLTNKTLTAPVIAGGTIDNAVIGGSTPAAVTATTVTAGGRIISTTGDLSTGNGISGDPAVHWRTGNTWRCIVLSDETMSWQRNSTERVALTFSEFRPGADNSISLGTGSYRWSVVYAGTGSINTSDEREKEQIGNIPDEWLDAWGDVEWSQFKFIDGNRWHVGLVAQRVHRTFAIRGLDAFERGLCCFDKWPAVRARKEIRNRSGKVIREARAAAPAGDRWGLRYDECLAMEAAYQRRTQARMEARIAALETQALSQIAP